MANTILTGRAELTEVAFQYAGAENPVFQQQSWEIEAGSFVVVTGSSGSGKSTLLRLLNGLVPHFSGGAFGGQVTVSGHDTLKSPTRDLSRHAGFVFQDADSSAIAGIVEDEIAFGLEQLATPVAEMRRQVEELLVLLGIEQLRGRQIGTLSGGERQRVAIAAAMAMNPSILILDEPTSQLDPAGADDVFQVAQRLNDEHGMTIVIAEHRMERVAHLADRLTIVRRGESIVDGAPRDVFQGAGRAFVPSLFGAGELLGWSPLPLSVREGRRLLANESREFFSGLAGDRRTAGRSSIELTGVELRFDQRVVLRGVDLSFRRGQIVAVMGANGSGKTTLLRAIAGLHRPSRGEIRVEGRQIDDIAPRDIGRLIGFLPQRSRTLLFNNTVREEIEFSLRHRGKALETVPLLLEEFGLIGFEDRHPHDISIGEQEELALAATMAGDPPVLLLDEPTRGLDAERKSRLAQSLLNRADAGTCIVLSTHDVEFAALVADRILLLGGAEVVADGSPIDVMDGSLVYGTQINKAFGSGMLTLDDVRRATESANFGDTPFRQE